MRRIDIARYLHRGQEAGQRSVATDRGRENRVGDIAGAAQGKWRGRRITPLLSGRAYGREKAFPLLRSPPVPEL